MEDVTDRLSLEVAIPDQVYQPALQGDLPLHSVGELDRVFVLHTEGYNVTDGANTSPLSSPWAGGSRRHTRSPSWSSS